MRTITSTAAKKSSAKICVIEPSKEMVLLSSRESAIIFGAMTEVMHTSKKDRNAKKKYIGDPSSAGLQRMVTAIIMFPPMVAI